MTDQKTGEGIMKGLVALDDRIRNATHASAAKGAEIAPPGSGLHGLLSIVASQFLGVPVEGFPAEPAAKPAAEPAGTASHVETGSLSAQAIEAGTEAHKDEGATAKAQTGTEPDGKKHHR